jgi:hypothetical protein
MIAHVATSQKRGRNGFPGLHSLKFDNLNLLLEERNDESSLKMGDLSGLWNLKLCWHKTKITCEWHIFLQIVFGFGCHDSFSTPNWERFGTSIVMRRQTTHANCCCWRCCSVTCRLLRLRFFSRTWCYLTAVALGVHGNQLLHRRGVCGTATWA